MKNIFLIHGYHGIPKIFIWLGEELKKLGYNVITPEFPLDEGVAYKEWKKTLDKNIQYFNSDSIVIAHSIGNEFIIRYFNENDIKIKLYISLCGFSKYFEKENRDNLNRALKDFLVTENELENFKSMCDKKYSIYSDNDHLVPFDILEEYPKSIDSIPILIKNIGHMGKKSGLEKIPEVVEIIQKVYE